MGPARRGRVGAAAATTQVRLLDRLDHENIIDFHGSWVNRERGEVCFITEILSSGSLKRFIQKVQVVRWKIIKRWMRQILKALKQFGAGRRRTRVDAAACKARIVRPWNGRSWLGCDGPREERQRMLDLANYICRQLS